MIKLIYEAKKEGQEEKHLYASATGIPADTDEQLAYDPTYDPETQISFYTKSANDGVRTISFNDSRRQLATPEDAEMNVSAEITIDEETKVFDVINNVEITEPNESEGEPEANEPVVEEPPVEEPVTEETDPEGPVTEENDLVVEVAE